MTKQGDCNGSSRKNRLLRGTGIVRGADVIGALIDACRDGNNAVVETLIRAGADVNAVNENGKTALILATENGNNEIVEALKRCSCCAIQ